MGYDAFISYSHETDRELAKSIEEGLERFAKPWHRRRSLNVFRDSSGLSANPGLWTSIADAMESSDWFVLLCSPASATSPWVGREIEQWVATKPEGRILPVLTAGTLAWDQAAGTFDLASSTAAHPAMVGAFDEEPLWVDLRFADTPDARSLRDPRFQDAIADLGAPMRGIAKDELIGEDIRQHRRTLRYAWAAVAGLVVLALGTIIGAVVAINNAQETERLADQVLAANLSIEELNEKQAAAQQQLDDTTLQLESAQSELADANEQAAAAGAERDQANVARDAAQRDSERFQGIAGLAQATAEQAQRDASDARFAEALAKDLEGQANMNAAAARQNERAAIDGQHEAEARAADAERAEEQALVGKADADRQAAASAQEAARQGDIARATQLATESMRAGLRDGHMDLATLLAVEAASIFPDGNDRASVVPDAHGALLSAVTDGAAIEGYLHFDCRAAVGGTCQEPPQRLGKVAVSPDQTMVAAIEDSTAIQLGEANARLFVWHDADVPGRAQVVELASDLRCVTDLQWAKGNALVTVEAPDGCLNPRLIAVDAQGLSYDQSIIRLWDPFDSTTSRDLCGPNGAIALRGRSPVAASADHTFLAMNCNFGFADDLGPLANAVVLDGPSVREASGLRVDFLLTRAIGMSFSPKGQFAHGYDWLTDENVVLDLGAWSTSDECPAGCFAKTTIESAGLELFLGLTFGAPGADGRERYAAALVQGLDPTSTTPQIVAIFDVTTGEAVHVLEVDAGVAGATLAFEGQMLVVSEMSGHVRFVSWQTGGEAVLPMSPPPRGCGQHFDIPALGEGTTLLFLERLCTDADDRSVIVVDLNAVEVLRELRGRLMHASTNDRYVVTEQLDVRSHGDVQLPHFGFELWDFGCQGDGCVRTPGGRLVSTGTDVRPQMSSDARLLVAVPSSIASDVEGATVWTLDDDGPRGPQRLPGSAGTRAVAFADSETLVGVGRMGAAVVWKPGNTAHTELFRDTDVAECAVGEPSSQNTLLRSAASRKADLRAVATDARTVEIVDLGGHGRDQAFTLGLTGDLRIRDMFFAPNDELLLVNVEASNGTCRGGEPIGSIIVPLGALSGAQVYPGEIAVGGAADGGALLFVNLDAAEVILRSRDASEVHRIDTSELPPPPGGIGNLYVVDPSGTRIAGTNSSGRVVVWDVNTGESMVLATSVQPTSNLNLFGLHFSPDGTRLAVKSVDQRLRVHNLVTGEVRVQQLPTDAAARVVYSPGNGRFIAVDGGYLYDAATLRPIGGRLWPAHWNDPGRDLGSQATRFVEREGGLFVMLERVYDTEAVLYQIDVESLRRMGCERTGRNLTPNEFGLYLPGRAYRPTCPS